MPRSRLPRGCRAEPRGARHTFLSRFSIGANITECIKVLATGLWASSVRLHSGEPLIHNYEPVAYLSSAIHRHVGGFPHRR